MSYDLKAIDAEIARRAASSSLMAFTRATYPQYAPAPHHRRIASALEAVERGEIKRLRIEMPPRFGKSELASIRFPAWFLGRNPNRKFIMASYASDFASGFGRKARNLARDEVFRNIFPACVLSEDSQSQASWTTTAGGEYTSTGILAGITGKGANIVLLDDVFKNREECLSPVIREKVWDEYQATVYTRLEGDGSIVIINTRWHDDDLSGRVEEAERNGGDKWTVLKLPAISNGESLWPEKFPLSQLENIRANIKPSHWAALYQQEPILEEGATFRSEWWKYYETKTDYMATRIVQCWDTAFKDKPENDRSACITVAIRHDGLYIVDCWAGRVEFPMLRDKVRELYDLHKPSVVVVEDKASGQSIIQEFQRPSRRGDRALPILPHKVDKSKEARADAASAMVCAGKVFLPKSAPWLDMFLSEVGRFPSAKHDDITDAFTMALEYIGYVSPAPDQSEVKPSSLAQSRHIPKDDEDEATDSADFYGADISF